MERKENGGNFRIACFVRLNSKRIRRRLEEIGYMPEEMVCPAMKCTITNVSRGDAPRATGTYFTGSDDDAEYVGSLCGSGGPEFADCGDNEELFMAAAALRDDTDRFQYFVLDCNLSGLGEGKPIARKGAFALCESDRWAQDIDKDGNPRPYSSSNIPAHKATLDELRKHFAKRGKKAGGCKLNG